MGLPTDARQSEAIKCIYCKHAELANTNYMFGTRCKFDEYLTLRTIKCGCDYDKFSRAGDDEIKERRLEYVKRNRA